MKKFVILASIVSLLAMLTACNGKSSEDTNTAKQETKSEIMEEVSGEDLLEKFESDATFGHVALGIQTQVPKIDEGMLSSQASAMVYPRGYTLRIRDGLEITVDTSMNGENDIEKLPVAIIEEKKDITNHLTDDTSHGLVGSTKLENTKNVQIGEYDAFYFEIKEEEEDTLERKYLGYSFLYGDKAICVSATYTPFLRELGETEIREILQYTISSLKEYNGEAFSQLQPANNIAPLYQLTAGINEENPFIDGPTKTILIRGYENGALADSDQMNRGLQSKSPLYPYKRNDKIMNESLLKEGLTYDTLLQHITEDKEISNEFFGYFNVSIDILEEQDVTIAGIQMKRYEVKGRSDNMDPLDYYIIHTAIIDGIPFVVNVPMDRFDELPEYTETELAYELDLMRIQADTMMRTLEITE